jgi:hypothetical protein
MNIGCSECAEGIRVLTAEYKYYHYTCGCRKAVKSHKIKLFITLDGLYFTYNSTLCCRKFVDTFGSSEKKDYGEYERTIFVKRTMIRFVNYSNSRPPMSKEFYDNLKINKATGEIERDFHIRFDNDIDVYFQRLFDCYKPDMREAAIQLYKAELMMKEIKLREKLLEEREIEINAKYKEYEDKINITGIVEQIKNIAPGTPLSGDGSATHTVVDIQSSATKQSSSLWESIKSLIQDPTRAQPEV